MSAAASGAFDLAAIRLSASFARSARTADDAVSAAKGLPLGVPLLQARPADPGMATALRRGATPLIAATPTDDEAASLIGYDPVGHAVRLDTARRPDRPVLLVEVDTARAPPLGVDVMRQRLAGRSAPAASATTGYWATKVDAVRLGDDEEPWFKGAAEIYSVIGGFGLDGAAKVDIVQMPAGTYAPLVDAILAAIPGSWYTDDPDYVDSWYTLSTTSSGHLDGAAGNGWMDVSPYFVQPL